MTPQDRQTIIAMTTWGGSFVQALATALMLADADNFARLKGAFPEYFEKYGAMVGAYGVVEKA